MKEIHPVEFGIHRLDGVLHTLRSYGYSYSDVFVLADDGIPEAARIDFLGDWPHEKVLVLRGGETVKNIHSVEKIWEFLLAVKADRNALIVNLGGGALCDAGGFAASTFKRGIDFVHMPSTLLSMVDASVGGKTAINVGGIKNTVGTFTMPQCVFIHPPLLASLPAREMLSGYAELIKHGIVGNKMHLDNVLREFESGGTPSVETIRDSIHIKLAVVGRDPYEKGERKLLNFGHTIGHGLESHFTGTENEILHGEAVAAGIVAEMYLSNKLLNYPDAYTQRFHEVLKPLTSQVKVHESMIAQIIQKIQNDKKNEGEEIGIVLLNENGHAEHGKTVSLQMIDEALRFLCERLDV